MALNPKREKKRNTYKSWTLAEKLDVIKMRDDGANWVKIAQEKIIEKT